MHSIESKTPLTPKQNASKYSKKVYCSLYANFKQQRERVVD